MITTLSLNACWNRTCLIQCNKQARAKTLSTTLSYLYFQTFVSFAFPYFNSNVLYSIHFFCIPCFFCGQFVFECFVFIQVFDFSKHSMTLENMYRLSCCFPCVVIFVSNLASLKLSWSLIPWLEFYRLKYCITLELLNADLPYVYTCQGLF